MSDDGASEWLYPELPENSTIIRVDQPVQIRWTPQLQDLIPEYIPVADINHVDLWLVDTQSRTKIHLITRDLNMSISDGWNWNGSVPDQEVATVDLWEFNFMDYQVSPLYTAECLRSPQFSLRNSPGETSTSAATTGNTSSNSTSNSTNSSASSPTIVSTTPPSPMIVTSTGLSPSATAGLAVGSAIAAIVSMAACWYLARYLMKRNSNKEAAMYPQSQSSPPPAPPAFKAGENTENIWIQPYESLQPDQRQELQTINDTVTPGIPKAAASHPTLAPTSRNFAIEMPGR